VLAGLLAQAPIADDRVLQGPGIGLDCAILDLGDTLLVLKSDPITFASEDIGWYAVQVNANDLATTGATPRWMLATLLLPENQTTEKLVSKIGQQLFDACRGLGISLIGGHTEITYGLTRPILSATMIGEVRRDKLVSPTGAKAGDVLLLTKGVPIEATAILAREFSIRLTQGESQNGLKPEEIAQALDFLFHPGISVLQDARVALKAGEVHAMHDPTEGGIYTAIWELAQASGHDLWFNPEAVPVPELSAKICQVLGVDPLAAIASGALLLAVPLGSVKSICSALMEAGIPCATIGKVLEPSQKPQAWQPAVGGKCLVPDPARDEIARLMETKKAP